MAADGVNATQEQQDDDLIRQLIENPETLEVPIDASGVDLGPKADDAVDYEDWGDDDLAEEVDEPSVANVTGLAASQSGINDTFGPDNNGPDEFEDLFGDNNLSPEIEKKFSAQNGMSYDFEGDEVLGQPIGPIQDDIDGLFGNHEPMDDVLPTRDELDEFAGLSKEEKEALRLQRKLFAQAGGNVAPTRDFFDDAPQNPEDALAQMWPKFQKDQVPRFLELLPFKKARWIGKKPLKAPKPVQPTKLKLDLALDQEKLFKLSIASQKRKHVNLEENGLVRIIPLEKDDESDDDGESDLENEIVGGVTWQEMQTICADWDLLEGSDSSDFELLGEHEISFGDEQPSKKRKSNSGPALTQRLLNAPIIANRSFDDYQALLEKSAKRVVLDIRDPNLLLVPLDFDLVPKKSMAKNLTKDGRMLSTKDMLRRYNISNDAAYDKLKQNHQSKIRNTLGNLTLNHSMPALRLTYPFYKTNLSRDERRRLHRPTTTFRKREPITFRDLKSVKKRHYKNKDAKEVFQSSRDLGLGETSYSLLLEYSEEAPTILSNFGMNSRLITYYRKKSQDDEDRPKVNLGELNVLMPNDTSPLTQFGEIKPGEVRPTIYNAMYKAPVFEHKPKASDFLMIRSGTDLDNSTWHIRPIENMMVIGQQFPSTDVPPPGGRKVTTVSKNRLKSISYRLMKKNSPTYGVNISKVTEHVAESSDMQNRQKMKEFLTFNKETKEWEMQNKAPVPDEETIRSYIAPEDVCLLESMQVGEQRLEDEGFGLKQDATVNEDEEAKDDQSIQQQLAPWHTTKNFLSAASNKAMLQLYGEGDPTGRMEAFSFLKVSMKGGFRAPNQSIEDTLDAKKRAESSGHNYNVQRQQEQYRETIADIWGRQIRSLSSHVEHDLPEPDSDDEVESATRRSMSIDPRASFTRRTEDDATSAWSSASQRNKVCRIVRNVRNDAGEMVEQVELIDDPMVWKRYVTIKHKQARSRIDINNLKGDEDPELVKELIQQEVERLQGNKERRQVREKQKAAASGDAGSPGGSGGPGKGGSTTRKCANCGQVGHIKTNKKLCPLLNGTSKPEDGGFGDAFAGS